MRDNAGMIRKGMAMVAKYTATATITWDTGKMIRRMDGEKRYMSSLARLRKVIGAMVNSEAEAKSIKFKLPKNKATKTKYYLFTLQLSIPSNRKLI